MFEVEDSEEVGDDDVSNRGGLLRSCWFVMSLEMLLGRWCLVGWLGGSVEFC